MHGLGVGLHGSLLAGASIVLQPSFDPEAVLAPRPSRGATLFFGVPTMYARLVEAPGADRLGRPAPVRVRLGADERRAARAGAPARAATQVLERYGMTETVMLVSNPYDGERRAGTVGIPLPGVDLRLDRRPSRDRGARAERVRRLLRASRRRRRRRSPTTAGSAPVTSARSTTTGTCRIVGRAKELIISGGFNVYPREVEDVLRGHPSVIDVAVVGTPSPEWGETVTAYVEVDDDLDPATLIDWVADQLAPYKKPRIVHRVDALPRNAMGKVVRSELRPPD